MPPSRNTSPALRAIDMPYANSSLQNSTLQTPKPHAPVPAQPEARSVATPALHLETSSLLKRLTIDIPEPLHRRIKVACARRGAKMADEIRRLLEERYPDAA